MSKFSGSPYLSDYNKDKCFTNVLAVPGRVVQAREITEVGEIAIDFIGRLGDAMLNNGAIISGCTCNVDKQNKLVYISEGLIYLDGLVRISTAKTLTIKAEGTENIGVKIQTDIVTADIDKALLDPALGYENAGSAGADRCKETVLWGVDLEGYVTVYQLIDGELVTEPPKDNSELLDILARRTYDENGSYRVNGLQISKKVDDNGEILVDNTGDILRYKCLVTAGKAYVKGWECERLADTTILIDELVDTGSQSQVLDVTETGFGEYRVSYGPVAAISSLTGMNRVPASAKQGFRSNGSAETVFMPECWQGEGAAAFDADHWQIARINKLWWGNPSPSGSGAIVLVEDVDFTYSKASQVLTWKLTGGKSLPPQGTTFYCDLVLKVSYVPATSETAADGDYILQTNGFKIIASCKKPPSRQLSETAGDKGEVDIDYTFKFPRIDLICLNKDNEIQIVKGVPNYSRFLVYPTNSDASRIPLGYVRQDSGEFTITNILNYRLTQDELNSVRSDLATLERNLEITDLDREAEDSTYAREPATDLNGIFTDGFLNYYKFDLSSNNYSKDAQNRRRICSIDFATNDLTLPVYESVNRLDLQSSTGESWGRVLTAGLTSPKTISQPMATDNINVNPYAAVDPLCMIQINPAIDVWFETAYRVVNDVKTETINITRNVKQKGKTILTSGASRVTRSTTSATTSATTASFDSQTYVVDTVIEYMRQQDITLEGFAFPPDTKTLVCYFDGERVAIEDLKFSESNVYSDPNDGKGELSCLQTNESGECRGKFRVPAGHQCGTVKVRLEYKGSKDDLIGRVGASAAVGETVYQAQGTLTTSTTVNTTTITTTNTTINTTVLTTYVHVNNNDPIAQSFSFDQTKLLTKVGLYFAQKYPKDTPDYKKYSPVVVQICGMTNGYPNKTVYATKTLDPDDINIATPFNFEGKETVVTFDQPVLCEANQEYCIVVMSDCQAYKLWYAELGKDRVDRAGYVVSNPYMAGVMFSSSNHSTWTAHQACDLTFNVYTADFTNPAVVQFDQVTVDQFCSLLLAAETIDYASSGIKWEYKIVGQQENWQPITSYSYQEMSDTIAQMSSVTISVRCTLMFTNDTYTSMSSILAADCVSLSFLTYAIAGEYISRYCAFNDSFDIARIQCEVYLPGQNTERTVKTAATPYPNVTNVGLFLARGVSAMPFTHADDHQPYEPNNSAKVGDSADQVLDYIQYNNAAATRTGGSTVASKQDWNKGFLASAINLGFGWWRFEWYKHFDAKATGFTVGARLFAKSLIYRPRMRKLMVSVSTNPAS